MTCPKCYGDGEVDCEDCDGMGCAICGYHGVFLCPDCQGDGDAIDNLCDVVLDDDEDEWP